MTLLGTLHALCALTLKILWKRYISIFYTMIGGTERLSNLPKVTKLVSGRDGIQSQATDSRACAVNHYNLAVSKNEQDFYSSCKFADPNCDWSLPSFYSLSIHSFYIYHPSSKLSSANQMENAETHINCSKSSLQGHVSLCLLLNTKKSQALMVSKKVTLLSGFQHSSWVTSGLYFCSVCYKMYTSMQLKC